MADKIIQHEHLESHVIQPYRLKVLGGYVAPQASEFIAGLSIKNLDEEPVENGYTHLDMQKLLDRIDELLEDVKTLQSELTTKQNEFAKHLEESLQQEHENAYAQGFESAKKELENVVNEQQLLYGKSIKQLDDLDAFMREKMVLWESELSETAVVIAQEVIQEELSQGSVQITLALCNALLRELKEATKIHLHIHPKDVDAIKKHYADFEHVIIVADDAIALGGVVALSDKGNIDNSLEMRLKKAKYMIQEN